MKASSFVKNISGLTALVLLFSGATWLLAGCQKAVDEPSGMITAQAMPAGNEHQKNVPFKAEFLAATEALQEPAPGIPLIHHLFGPGTGSHIGQSNYESYVTLDVFSQPLVGTATATITAANGDQIYMNQTGTISFDGNGAPTVSIVATITGGTGRFVNSSGTLSGEVTGVSPTEDRVTLGGIISY